MPEFDFIIFGGLYLSVKRENLNEEFLGRSIASDKKGNAVLVMADSRDPDIRKIDSQYYFEIDFDSGTWKEKEVENNRWPLVLNSLYTQ
jgi:hypothetical protein